MWRFRRLLRPVRPTALIWSLVNEAPLNWDITATESPRADGGLHFETTDVSFHGGTGRFEDAAGYAGGAGNSIPGEGENYYYVGCLAY